MSFSNLFHPNRCYAYIISLLPNLHALESLSSHHSHGVSSFVFFKRFSVLRAYPYHMHLAYARQATNKFIVSHIRKLRMRTYCTVLYVHSICFLQT